MNLIAAIFVVAMFVVLVYVLGIVERAREVVAISRESAGVMASKTLGDDDKEAAIQKNTLRLLSLLIRLTVGFAIALVAPIGVVWLVGLSGVVSVETVLAILVRWDFMAAATVFGIAAYFVLAGRKR